MCSRSYVSVRIAFWSATLAVLVHLTASPPYATTGTSNNNGPRTTKDPVAAAKCEGKGSLEAPIRPRPESGRSSSAHPQVCCLQGMCDSSPIIHRTWLAMSNQCLTMSFSFPIQSQMPDPKTYKQHFENKHPKAPMPEELKDVQV